MICFYHDDLDGRCAAFWVQRAARERNGEEVVFVPVDYRESGEELLGRVSPGEDVYVVDYSLAPKDMLQLLKKTESVVWIDHHKTAIENYREWSGPAIPGSRVDGVAACVLTYLYFVLWTNWGAPPRTVLREPTLSEWSVVPTFTKLIGDKDAWRWEFKETLYFCSGLEAYDTSPHSSVWVEASANAGKFVREGRLIEQYKQQERRELLRRYAFEVTLEGLKGLACNTDRGGSLLFEVLDEDVRKRYDLFVTFIWDGKQYAVSLYSNSLAVSPVDVSLIAQKFGGGGHAGAAGFECEKLPFKVKEG